MKLTNEQIEQILNDAPNPFIDNSAHPYIDSSGEYWFSKDVRHNLDDLRETLLLRKRCTALEMQIEGQSRCIKQLKKELEAVINEESDGVNGVV